MLTADTFRRGLGKGISITWELSKIVVPVYVLVTFLKHTPAFNWIAGFCEPAMRLVGLPGEASIAVVLGLFTNLYAAIGAIASLNLSPKEVTIIALMLLITHSLPMEAAVAQRVGVSGLFMTSVRIALSILSGLLLNWIL